mgnify:CR=1 FL=1
MVFLFGRKPHASQTRRLHFTRYEYIPITSETSGLHAKLNTSPQCTPSPRRCARGFLSAAGV